MTVEDERRAVERRSPVGDFLLGALALRGEEALPYAELLETAAHSGLNMSTVLAWASRAEEAGLIEQSSGPDGHGRCLRLTPHGVEIARNNRRRAHRRDRWIVRQVDVGE